MPVWTGKYRTPKTLSSSCFMQTSGKGKKGIVLLPHLERPEHNSPSAEELWSRAVHPGAQGMTCAGPEEPSDAPGAQGHWECTRWGSSRDRCHRESYLNTDTGPEQLGTLYSTKPHVLQVQWSAKSPSRRRDALSWGESCKNHTHH